MTIDNLPVMVPRLPVQCCEFPVTRWFSCRRSAVCTSLLTLALVCAVNRGAAVFTDAATRPAAIPTWGDLDGDGQPDEVVIQRHGTTDTVGLLLSTARTDAFLDVGPGFVAVSAFDVDGDGDLDLVTTSANGAEFWLNDGHGVFTRSRRPSSRRLSALPDTASGGGDSLVAVFATPSTITVPLVMDPVRDPTRIGESVSEFDVSALPPSACRPRAPPPLSRRS